MDASKIKGDPQETCRRLAEPFFLEGARVVYMATCCHRLFAGTTNPKKCRKCDRSPASVAFNSLAEVNFEMIPDQPLEEETTAPTS
jgi:hypothetical protein